MTNDGLSKIKLLQEEMNSWDKKAKLTELSAAENEELCAARFHYFSAAKEYSSILK